MVDLLSHELLPFVQNSFSWLFLAMLSHIWMKVGRKLPYEELQIKFDFRHGWPTFSWVIALCSKFVFRIFLCEIMVADLNLLGRWGICIAFSNTLSMLVFILNFSLPPRSEQVSEAHVNEIKHDHSPVVIVADCPIKDLATRPFTHRTASGERGYIVVSACVFMSALCGPYSQRPLLCHITCQCADSYTLTAQPN